MFLMLCGCATEPLIPEPVIVEVPGPVRHIPVPAELLAPGQLSPIPDTATYSQIVELLITERATIQAINGQLTAIGGLR